MANGYPVVLSNSRGPETLASLVKELGPSACAGTTVEAARAGDLVVVTIPLAAYRDVPVEPLAAYQWEEPFVADDSRFRARFGDLATPAEAAARATARWAAATWGTGAA